MWGSFDPYAQIKKRREGFGRRRREFFKHSFFGQEEHYNHNNGWGSNNNNNGWGENNNNNGWGNGNGWGNNNNNNNNNNGWGNDNGWGNNSNNNNNGWGNENNNNNNNGWGENNNNSLWNNINPGPVTPFQMNDIKKMIENQIVLIEPSPHKKKLEELKKNGQVFKDSDFPPN